MDTSKLKLRFKLRPNEEIVTFMSIPPRRYLLVGPRDPIFLREVRKATHQMNMPVQHVYSSNGKFEGFRAPHYVIEDVRWKMEMKEKGISIEASPKREDSDNEIDEIEKLIREMDRKEEKTKKVERKKVEKLSYSEESSWLEDDEDDEMDSEDEDEDYVPSSDGESSTVSEDYITLRSGRTVRLRLKE
ncbi:hypothetical protein RRF57_011399 [Xylaria bambusicola]|uniref:Uncharacterized protein n=1 Tax=Xylaria bambusicola TaxID=326684 RepID=A0AAN7Z9R7_9PEZI